MASQAKGAAMICPLRIIMLSTSALVGTGAAMICPLRRFCRFSMPAATSIPGCMGSDVGAPSRGARQFLSTKNLANHCAMLSEIMGPLQGFPDSPCLPTACSQQPLGNLGNGPEIGHHLRQPNISKVGSPLAGNCHNLAAAAISVAEQATSFHAAYAKERAKEWLMALDVEYREDAGLGQAEFHPLWESGLHHQAMAVVMLVPRNLPPATSGSQPSAEELSLFLCVAAASQRDDGGSGNEGSGAANKSRIQQFRVRYVVLEAADEASKQQGIDHKPASAAAAAAAAATVQVSTTMQTGEAEFESVCIPGLASLELLVSVVEAAPVTILRRQAGVDRGITGSSSKLSIEILDDATGSVLSALTMDVGKLWEPNPSAGCQEAGGIQQQMQVHSSLEVAAAPAVKNQLKSAEPPQPRSYTDLFRDWASQPIKLSPIGHVRSRFKERHGTPRQAVLADDSCSEADAELVLDLECVPGRALEALEGFDYAWLLTDLHLNRVGNPHVSGGHWNPMVRPPPPRMQRGTASMEEDIQSDSPSRSASPVLRSSKRTHERRQRKVGVLATRAPHRPNPIGLSAVRVVGVDCKQGRMMLRGVDLLDGTPVLDIKPYIPYADSFPNARAGWLDEDK